MRVALDGQLLAANESALALFGARELGDVVGHNLTDRIASDRGTDWSGFAARVWDTGPGSIECEITTVPGVAKSVLFQAVPLHDHPDAVRSLLLTARDVSTNRRLETALEHQDAVSPARDLRAELAQALAELDALHTERAVSETSRTESDTDQQRLAAEHAAEVARLTQTLTEHHQLTTQLTSRADEARAEQQRIAALLEQREAELEQREAEREQRDAKDAKDDHLVAELTAEQARLQQAIADEQHRVQGLEREARALDAVRTQLAGALAESAELKTTIERRDTEYQQLVTEQAVERAKLQQATQAEHERAHGFEQQSKQFADRQTQLQAALEASAADTADLKALLQQHEHALKELRSKLVNAAVERTRLDMLLKQRDAEEQRAAAAREAGRADADKAREEAARKHADIVKALADQKLELQILADNLRKIEPLAAAGRLAAEVHGELQTLLTQIEARAGRLIERCSLEAIERTEIEGLRIDTARAASLARQVVSPKADA